MEPTTIPSVVPNRDRLLVSAVRDHCSQRRIEFDAFSGDWVLRLRSDDRVEHVVGYTFPLNSSGATAVSNDKAAASELLRSGGVPCIEHKLFLRPTLAGYIGDGGNWQRMTTTADAWQWDLVVKPNEGTGGAGVVRVRTPIELEAAIQAGFVQDRSVALAPFYTVETEYRVVILDGRVLLSYGKSRPAVVGDGQRSLGLLAVESGLGVGSLPADAQREVIPKGQRRLLNWRHNLGQGARPVAIDDDALQTNVHNIAARAARTIGLRFCSIDVADTSDGLLVMETNSGVMLEHYAELMVGGADTAKAIYASAVDALFPTR